MPQFTDHEDASSRGGLRAVRDGRSLARPAIVCLAYLAAFLVLDLLTQGLDGSLSVSLWFLPVGLTFATLLVFGWRYAPVVALGFVLHLILFRDGLDYPVGILLALPVCYAAIYAGTAALLVGGVGVDPRLLRMRDVAWFVGAGCFLAPFLGGVVAVSGMSLAGYVPEGALWENVLGVWAGDATGVGVLAPLLLVASRPFRSVWSRLPAGSAAAPGFRAPSRGELPEVALQAVALVLALAVAHLSADGHALDYAYIALAPLVWATLRGGFERATIAVLLANIGVVAVAGVAGGDPEPVVVQFGLMALTLAGLLLGGLASEHFRTETALAESEMRFRSLVQNSSEVVKILDADGTLRYASPAFGRAFGRAPEEVVDKNIYEYVHPEDLPLIIEETEKALAEPGAASNKAEYRFRHADGSWRHVESIGTYLLDDPAVRGVVVNTRDVTDRRLTEEKLEQSNDLLRAIMEGTDDAAFVKDLEGRYLLINRAGAEALGMGAEEVIGKDDTELFSPEDAREVMELDRRVIRTGETFTTEDTKEPAEGEAPRTFLSTRGPYRDVGGNVIGVFGVSRDITERKNLEERIAHQAYHDPLTGLPNRALLLDRLDGALARAARRPQGRRAALLFLDLDGFKVVNDSMGHEAGDRLLVEAAGRLEGLARSGDTIARLGGDEFCVLLEDADAEEVTRVAERILEEFSGAPFLLDGPEDDGGRRLFVSASVGMAVSRPDHRPSDLLREADLAMYRAKEEGKGRYAHFEPYLSERARERARLQGDLRRAIERGEFELLYQPQVCLGTGRILWMEALLRWNHPERGLLLPQQFVGLAEETNLICPISSWVLEEALRQGRRWREEHAAENGGTSPEDPENRPAPPGVCVNFSAKQLPEEGLVEAVGKILDGTGAAPGTLGMEITESVLMEDERAVSALLRLRKMGVALAIDDFGTGYSSLSYLETFPANILKIDGSFVHDLGTRPEKTAVVSGLVKLAHATGKEVVAECVETPRQLEVLQDLGCELGQGYLFARPLPAEEAARLVRTYRPEDLLRGPRGEFPRTP